MVHRWTGPFMIADYLGKGVYKEHGRKTVINISNMKKYYSEKDARKPAYNSNSDTTQLVPQKSRKRAHPVKPC